MKVLRRETVPIDRLRVSEWNVRKEVYDDLYSDLVDSVMSCGIIDDIIVDTNYEIISGQLRWLSAKKAGLKEVPVVVCQFEDDFDKMRVCILQDYVRHDLSDRDRGFFIKKCLELGLTPEEISRRTGIPRSTIALWAQVAKVKMELREKAKEEEKSELEKLDKLALKKVVITKRLVDSGQVTLKEAVKAAEELPERELLQVEKEVTKGVPVNIDKRIEMIKNRDTQLVYLRLPKDLFDKAVQIARRERKDLVDLLLEIIAEGIEKLWY
mgnify:CR=1 FL=1